MANWKSFSDESPKLGEHILVVFYWPDAEDYNMMITVWDGMWKSIAMEADGWGEGTYPTHWMPAPEYPE